MIYELFCFCNFAIGYGYTGTQVKATYSAGTTGAYQQKQTYVAATPATGYATTQRTTNSTPSYSTQAYQKPAKVGIIGIMGNSLWHYSSYIFKIVL